MVTEEMKARSRTFFGNPRGILCAMEKARRGENVTYVALGGSITQGACASRKENCYAALVAAWWEKTFPESQLRFVNAGIGATGSLIGLHRANRDVLAYAPDFITVEFGVNDTAVRNLPTAEPAYANLLHKLVNAPGSPGVLALNMATEEGEHMQHLHLPIARHYGVPYVSFADAVLPEWERDPALAKVWLKDGTHPTDTGYAVAAALVCDYLERLLSLSSKDFGDTRVETPYSRLNWQGAEMVCVGDGPCQMGCFEKGKTAISKIPYGWRAEKNGEPLVLRFENCTRIHVLYEYTNKGTGGKVLCDVNGRQTELNSDFVNGYGIYAHNVTVFESDAPEAATLTLTPMLDEGRSFTLMAVLAASRR